MLNRRQIISLAAAATLPHHARAQAWPERPIRIINPGAAGGTNDVLARILAEPLAKLLGQAVIVENKPGAGGIIGTQYVAQQPADGYTILTHHNGLITTPLVTPTAHYDPLKDFTPLSLQGTSPLILMVHPSMPPTLAEFVAYARNNPGKLEWGTAALGGIGHLATEVFNEAAGIRDMVKVVFSGSAPATQALLSGQIKYLLSTMTASTGALAQDGRLRLLGVGSPDRSPLLPQLPTISQVVPGFVAEAWFALVARAGTPEAIVARLAEAVSAVIAQPETVVKYRALEVVAQAGRKELGDLMRRDQETWAKVVHDRQITID